MIRKMEEADANRAAEIHTFGWRIAYRHFISDELLFKKMLVGKKTERFISALKNKTEETYVYDDKTIKGFLTIGPCRDEDKKGSFELWGIYIDYFMQEQGIGSKCAAFCEAEARDRGYKEICLWCFEENAKGNKFYESRGYKRDGKRNFIEPLNAWEARYVKRIKY